MDLDTHSDDRTRRAASVLSMDDLEAAQALEGLRTGTYIAETSHSAQYSPSRDYMISLGINTATVLFWALQDVCEEWEK